MKIHVNGSFTIYQSEEIYIDDYEIEDMTQTELEEHLDKIVNEWTERNKRVLSADEYGDIGYEILD